MSSQTKATGRRAKTKSESALDTETENPRLKDSDLLPRHHQKDNLQAPNPRTPNKIDLLFKQPPIPKNKKPDRDSPNPPDIVDISEEDPLVPGTPLIQRKTKRTIRKLNLPAIVPSTSIESLNPNLLERVTAQTIEQFNEQMKEEFAQARQDYKILENPKPAMHERMKTVVTKYKLGEVCHLTFGSSSTPLVALKDHPLAILKEINPVKPKNPNKGFFQEVLTNQKTVYKKMLIKCEEMEKKEEKANAAGNSYQINGNSKIKTEKEESAELLEKLQNLKIDESEAEEKEKDLKIDLVEFFGTEEFHNMEEFQKLKDAEEERFKSEVLKLESIAASAEYSKTVGIWQAEREKDLCETDWTEVLWAEDMEEFQNFLDAVKESLTSNDEDVRILERWNKMEDVQNPPSKIVELPKTQQLKFLKEAEMKQKEEFFLVADSLFVQPEQIEKLSFLNQDLLDGIEKLQDKYCGFRINALYKFLGVSMWQQRKLSECFYFLSQSHGLYLKGELLDRMALNLSRIEEQEYRNARHARLKKDFVPEESNEEEIHLSKCHIKTQTDAYLNFSNTQQDFTKNINRFPKDFQVIQITSVPMGQNRFSSDPIKVRETTPVFISCLSPLYNEDEKASFVAFVPEPLVRPGETKVEILDEMLKIIHDNKTLSEVVSDRVVYWQTRGDHNKRLSDLLSYIEERWFFPFEFLFPGNIANSKIRISISNKIGEFEKMLSVKLTLGEKLGLSKLMENYQLLSHRSQHGLFAILHYILRLGEEQKGISQETMVLIAEEIRKVGTSFKIEETHRFPTILILDQEMEMLPIDWLPIFRSSRSDVSRMPSLTSIHSCLMMRREMQKLGRFNGLSIDPNKVTYLLNPDDNLPNVQKRLEDYFSKKESWKGISGQAPEHDFLQNALQTSDIFLYCGHGSGVAFFPEYSLQKINCRSVALLMGCSSAQFKSQNSRVQPMSIVNSYFMAGCPAVVGFLYEVTDVECDRVTVELLERWAPGDKSHLPTMVLFDREKDRPMVNSLLKAVRLSRTAATQFLTEAAIVCYGMPVYTAKKNL